MNRFFIPKDCIEDDRVMINGAQAHQIRNVLRLKVGDDIVVLDNSGSEFHTAITSISRNSIEGTITSKNISDSEPRTRITLYQAILRKTRFEYVLQKCTEIGVTTIVPVICNRCVARWDEGKVERWQDIIREAAEQSRRGVLPELRSAISFKDACSQTNAGSDLSLLAWEDENKTGIRDQLAKTPVSRDQSVNIFIGPVGGFSPSEIDLAQNSKISLFSMGKRILRAETAGLVAASVILYESGDLGG